MTPINEVEITEVSTKYDAAMSYHSDLMAQNYDIKMTIIEEGDARITLLPEGMGKATGLFCFDHSDPDRVIAIAQMMMAGAQMVKNHNKVTPIDIGHDE